MVVPHRKPAAQGKLFGNEILGWLGKELVSFQLCVDHCQGQKLSSQVTFSVKMIIILFTTLNSFKENPQMTLMLEPPRDIKAILQEEETKKERRQMHVETPMYTDTL
jgi:hypothetical protein